MIKSTFSESSVVVPSILVIHSANNAQFLNATCIWGAALAVILPVTKM